MLATLKNGAWLTRGRVRAYCRLLLLMQVVAVLALLITSNGRVDMIGRPLGTDFISFYTAGKIVRTSPPADVYRPDAHYSAEQHIAGREDIPYYAYYYPPVFLPICWALSFLPYLAALLVWLGATGAAFVIAARSIAGPRETLLPILAYPACFLNVGHGQNGFLTAALFATATMQLDKRPWLAGALFGALCYKPQLALLVPVALLFGGCWRAFVAAALAAAALVGLSVAAFGVETWAAYVAVVPQVQSIFEAGGVGFEKMGSTFSALRLLGGTVEAARLAQAVATLLAAGTTAYIWRRAGSNPAARSATLATAALSASPLLLDYDLVTAVVAAAWIFRDSHRAGFLSWEKTGIAAAFTAPLISRVVGLIAHVPLASLVGPGLLVLAVRRALHGQAPGKDVSA